MFEFLNFLFWAAYDSMVLWAMHLHYDLAGRERNNVEQLSKLVELKFISKSLTLSAYSYK